MAAFKYRMQNILDIKEKLEDQQKMEYAKANAALKKEQDKLEELLLRRSNYQTKLREKQHGILDLDEIYFLKNAIISMSSMINAQLRIIASAQSRVDEEREKLNAAMQDRKMHEKLREKAFDEFKTELIYKEGKETDELVAYKYNNAN